MMLPTSFRPTEKESLHSGCGQPPRFEPHILGSGVHVKATMEVALRGQIHKAVKSASRRSRLVVTRV